MNTHEEYTEKMVKIALESKGANIFVFDQDRRSLMHYFEGESYLTNYLKNNKIKAKVDKNTLFVGFKNKSTIHFSPWATDRNVECLGGCEFNYVFIHHANICGEYLIKFLITKMRFGSWKPPENTIHTPQYPYIYREFEDSYGVFKRYDNYWLKENK